MGEEDLLERGRIVEIVAGDAVAQIRERWANSIGKLCGGVNRQTGVQRPGKIAGFDARAEGLAFKLKKPSQTGGKGDIRPTTYMLSPWSRPAPRLERHKIQRRPSLTSCELMSLNVVGLKTSLMPVEVMTSPVMPSPRWV